MLDISKRVELFYPPFSNVSFISRRVELLYRPFSKEPYSHSFVFYKICHYLACIKALQIEEDETFVVVSQVRMEIYSLVMYIYSRLRGTPARACNYEHLFQTYRLFRL